MRSSVIDKLTWKGNSKKMYTIILNAVPGLFKSTVKKEVEKWLIENKVDIITEELILKMFKEKAPKGMWEKIYPQLEKLKTENSK